jgi:phosphate-selective porin OprO/OprP
VKSSLSGVTLALVCAIAPAAPAAGDWKLEPFRLRNKKADFEVKLAGYVQWDFRSFPGWQVEEPTQRADGFDTRRLRLGVDLKWKKFSFEYVHELAGPFQDLTQDGEPPYDGAELKNLYGEYEFAKEFSFRVGHFKPPVSPEFLTSASRTEFQERSLLSNALAPDREWGAMAFGRIKKRLDYSIGVFAGDGSYSDGRAETTFATRLVFEAVKGLDLGGSFSIGDVVAEPDGPGTDPSPKGFRGLSPTGWRFYERKFVDGRRLRWGVDGQYLRGPFGFKAELLQGREQRQGQGSTFGDLPEEVGTGWSLTASWIATGEKKERSLKPKRPVTKGGPGLLELAARYESLHFDDAGPDTGFEGAGNRASNLRPARDRAVWFGVSWWPAEFMRVQGNALVEHYLDPLLAPEPPGARFVTDEPKGSGPYFTLLARIQFMFP